jgi:hypothetical protein
MKQTDSTRFLARETVDHIAATLKTINVSLDDDDGRAGERGTACVLPVSCGSAMASRGAEITQKLAVLATVNVSGSVAGMRQAE